MLINEDLSLYQHDLEYENLRGPVQYKQRKTDNVLYDISLKNSILSNEIQKDKTLDKNLDIYLQGIHFCSKSFREDFKKNKYRYYLCFCNLAFVDSCIVYLTRCNFNFVFIQTNTISVFEEYALIRYFL